MLENDVRPMAVVKLPAVPVAQTGSLPYRGLVIREAFPFSMACRMPFGDTADYQSALRTPTQRRSTQKRIADAGGIYSNGAA